MNELVVDVHPDERETPKRPSRSVMRQQAKLAYVSPRLTSIARVSPIGYREETPVRSDAISLQQMREERGLSVRALAKISGISPSTIYRIERGETWNRPHVAHAVSTALGCSPWSIIEFWDIMETYSLPRD